MAARDRLVELQRLRTDSLVSEAEYGPLRSKILADFVAGRVTTDRVRHRNQTSSMRHTLLAALEPCKVYTHEAFVHAAKPDFWNARGAGAHWERDPFSTELKLQRAYVRRPAAWTAASIADADLVYVAANYSQLCVARKEFTLRRELTYLAENRTLYPNESSTRPVPPKLVSLQYIQGCMQHTRPKADTIWMRDQILLTGPGSSAYRDEPTLVAPFAVAQPQWLLSGRVPKPLPWAERNQVVFLGGHVPKLYLMPLRYLIWQQLYANPRAWTQSFGINCTVGAYEICDHPDLRKPRGAPATHPDKHVYHTFCNDACAAPPDASHVHTATRSKAINARGKEYRDSEGNFVGDQPSCLGTWRQTTQHAAAKLRDDCLRYRVVDYKAEAAAIRRDTARSAGREQYLEAASRSRFCIIAQGDPGNTAKVMETVALGGAGGCIPLYVLYTANSPQRPPVEQDFVRDLPHVRWLDYCEIAYFVSHHAARTNMSRVVEILADVTAEQAEAKFRALRAVRPAFVYRRNSSFERPSAAEFLLSDACHMARRARAQPAGRPAFEVAGGAHGRCTIAMRDGVLGFGST